MIDNGQGIYTIDSHYWREKLAAVYLVKEGNQVALVETAHAKSLPYVMAGLSELGVTSQEVKYIFLTHIHLDHAGGAGCYMEAFPNALLVVHPKGVRHMINPSKLEAGAIAVYGEEFVRETYGKLLPIDEARILVAEDGLEVDLNGRKLICRNAPGHANHHNIIFDSLSQGLFSGDVFGIGYPELNVNGETLVFPSSTPVNFDPQKMLQSIELIESYQPQAIYLTHFGVARNVATLLKSLRQMIPEYVKIALEAKDSNDKVAVITDKLNRYFIGQARLFGVTLSDQEIIECAGLDMQINAQGLAVWLDSQH